MMRQWNLHIATSTRSRAGHDMTMLRARLGVLFITIGYAILPREGRAYIDHVMNLGQAAMKAPPKPETDPTLYPDEIETCGQTSFRLH
jgi:hypothetical protein